MEIYVPRHILVNKLIFINTSQSIYRYIAIWSGDALYIDILDDTGSRATTDFAPAGIKNNDPCLQLISALFTYFLLTNTFPNWQKCRRNVSVTLCILLNNYYVIHSLLLLISFNSLIPN